MRISQSLVPAMKTQTVIRGSYQENRPNLSGRQPLSGTPRFGGMQENAIRFLLGLALLGGSGLYVSKNVISPSDKPITTQLEGNKRFKLNDYKFDVRKIDGGYEVHARQAWDFDNLFKVEPSGAGWKVTGKENLQLGSFTFNVQKNEEGQWEIRGRHSWGLIPYKFEVAEHEDGWEIKGGRGLTISDYVSAVRWTEEGWLIQGGNNLNPFDGFGYTINDRDIGPSEKEDALALSVPVIMSMIIDDQVSVSSSSSSSRSK